MKLMDGHDDFFSLQKHMKTLWVTPALETERVPRREPIEYPNAKIVEGFAPVMLPYQFTDDEFEAMIAYAVERLAVSGKR